MKTRIALILLFAVLLLAACKPKEVPIPDSPAELQPEQLLSTDLPFWHPFHPQSTVEVRCSTTLMN